MNIDFRELGREPVWLLACAIGLIGIKALLIIRLRDGFACRFRRHRNRPAAGSRGRVRLRCDWHGSDPQLVGSTSGSFTLAVTSLTMALIPLLATAARRLSAGERKKPIDPILL